VGEKDELKEEVEEVEVEVKMQREDQCRSGGVG
jgi:hypothetical protein